MEVFGAGRGKKRVFFFLCFLSCLGPIVRGWTKELYVTSDSCDALAFSPSEKTDIVFSGESVAIRANGGYGLRANEPGESGTVTLKTDNPAFRLNIFAMGENACAAVDLTDVENFTLKLEDPGVLSAIARSNVFEAEGVRTAAVGIPSLALNEGTGEGITVKSAGGSVTFSSVANSESADAYAAVFGFGKIQTEEFTEGSSIGCRWLFDEIKRSSAYSYAHAHGASRATVFGAGSVGLLQPPLEGGPADAVALHQLFAKGWDRRPLRTLGSSSDTGSVLSDWVGKFSDNNVLVAVAISESGSEASTPAAAAVFGVPAAGEEWPFSLACDWTVEFFGPETIAAIGYGGPEGNVQLGTLGGCQNGSVTESSRGMRFYFRGPGVSSVAALRLESAPWLESDHVVLTLAAEEFLPSESSSWPRALAIGPNFQLNVGRTPKFENGKETADSIGSGGEAGAPGSAGTLCVLGAMAQAVGSPTKEGSTMRIDSNWTVDCFGPVQDWGTLEIFNGRLVLNSESCAATEQAIERAMAQQRSAVETLAANSFSFPLKNEVAIEYDRFVPRGRLTVGAGEKLIIHLDSSSGDLGTPFPFRRSGRIECVGACPLDGWIKLRQGAELVFAEDSDYHLLGTSSSSNAPPLGFLVLMANGALSANEVFGETLGVGARVTGTGCYRVPIPDEGPSVVIRRPDGETESLSEVSGAGLFWCNYANFSGLMICEESFPYFFEALRRVFSLGEDLERRVNWLGERLQELAQSDSELNDKMKTLATTQDLSEVTRNLELMDKELKISMEGIGNFLGQRLHNEIQEVDQKLREDLEPLLKEGKFVTESSHRQLEDLVGDVQSSLNYLREEAKTLLTKEEFQEFVASLSPHPNVGGNPGNGGGAQSSLVLTDGILAQAKGEFLEACGRTALQHMADVPGKGLFGGILGGTFRHNREDGNKFDRRDRFLGVLVGEGYVTDLPDNRIRCAVILGYGYDDVQISESGVATDKNVLRQEYAAELAAGYEHVGFRRCPLSLQFLFGCGIGVNNPYKGNDRGQKSPERFYDLGFFSEVGIGKDLFRGGPLLVGPWAEFRYDYLCQRAHSESVAGETVQVSQIQHDLITGRAGLRFVLDPHPASDSGLRLQGRVGWEWQPLQRSTTGEPVPGRQTAVPYHSRKAVVGALGLRTPIGSQWEFCTEINGAYSGSQIFGVANFSLNCLF
ncbi:MAG: autotransporter domain-containing protein [Puniceicoccales bacterium]|jgi:hypothetical protein|nr:autotransporter domain-containing protein [Puniceicoccales bacterium]